MMYLVLIAAVVVLYLGLLKLSLARRQAKFPEAQPIPVFINDHLMGFGTIAEMLKAMKNGCMPELGLSRYVNNGVNTVKVAVSGRTGIFTRDPENIKALLATQFADFSLGIRRPQFAPLLGEGIFTLDGQGWKHSRAMLRPQFAREQVAHVKLLEPHIQVLAKHIRNAQGKQFDIQELFFKLTVDLATEFLFGESVELLRDALVGFSDVLEVPGKLEFAECFNETQVLLALRLALQKLYWLYFPKGFRHNAEVVHKFTDYYVNKVLLLTPDELAAHSKSGYTFLYELAAQTRDPKVLRDQSLNILLAGRDTTAGMLSFLFHELAKFPQVYDRLREEIDQHFGLGDEARVDEITFELLKKCEYLKAVMNETLRLYPLVPRNARFCMKDTTLPRGGGPNGDQPVFVPKGLVVNYDVYSMHRNPEYYGKDLLEFRPERWLDSLTNGLGWAYLPFNGGPRICLGQQFALTETSYVTVRLLQMFSKIEDHNDGRMRKQTHLTMSLMDGCNIALT